MIVVASSWHRVVFSIDLHIMRISIGVSCSSSQSVSMLMVMGDGECVNQNLSTLADLRFNHHKSEKITPNAFYSCAICENRNWTAKSDQFKTNFKKGNNHASTFRQSESNNNKWASLIAFHSQYIWICVFVAFFSPEHKTVCKKKRLK